MMKGKRQVEILTIIAQTDVETQEQLMRALRDRGMEVTQATISRDIRELRLVKEMTQRGTYRYVLPEQGEDPRADDAGRLQTIFREGVVSFECAQNLVVVKTMPGLAPAAGAALDGMDIPGLVGTLAGDDTVLLILRTADDALQFHIAAQAMLDRPEKGGQGDALPASH